MDKNTLAYFASTPVPEKIVYNVCNRKTLEESLESIISGAALIADSR
jgi:hypothetical protein